MLKYTSRAAGANIKLKTSESILFFDLDGPILDVSERYFRVHEDVLKLLGVKCPAIDKARYWKMKRAGEPLGTIVRNAGGQQVDEAAFLDLWLKNIELPDYLGLDRVIPGAKKHLDSLSKKFDLVLVTLRQNQTGLSQQLRILGLAEYFVTVLSRAPLRSRSWEVKRDLIACSKLLSKSSWIIGDTEVDILAGKSLGIRTVGVLSGIRNRKVLEELEPDIIVKNIGELEILLSNHYPQQGGTASS